VILAQFAHLASHTVSSLALFQEDQAVGFSPMQLWDHMGWAVRAIAIVLFIESIWSLAVMIDRYLYFLRRPQAIARIRAQGCRRPEGQQAGRSHQNRRPEQEVSSGEVVTAGLQSFALQAVRRQRRPSRAQDARGEG